MLEEIDQFCSLKAIRHPVAAKEYPLLIRRFFAWTDKPLKKTTLEDIVAYQKFLNEQYKPATIFLHSTAIKQFYRYLNARGFRKVDAEEIQIPKIEYDPRPVLTYKEFLQIDETLGEGDFWELQKKVCHHLLWDTAARVSEICELLIADLSIKHCHALIRSKKSKQLGYIFWSPKTNKLLIKFLEERIEMSASPYLFIGWKQREQKLSVRSVERWIVEMVREAGIEKQITPHSYRHGRAHHILNKGGGVVEIQKVLRHTTPISSFRYVELNLKEIREIARRYL